MDLLLHLGELTSSFIVFGVVQDGGNLLGCATFGSNHLNACLTIFFFLLLILLCELFDIAAGISSNSSNRVISNENRVTGLPCFPDLATWQLLLPGISQFVKSTYERAR